MTDAAMPAASSGLAAIVSQDVGSGVSTGALASAGPDPTSMTPQSRKRPATTSPTASPSQSLSPSQPTPSYRKITLDVNFIRAPMRELAPQAPAEAKLESLAKSLNGAVDALSEVALLVNEHADKLRMHHEGISHRVLESRRLDTEVRRLDAVAAKHELDIAAQHGRDSALRQGV